MTDLKPDADDDRERAGQENVPLSIQFSPSDNQIVLAERGQKLPLKSDPKEIYIDSVADHTDPGTNQELPKEFDQEVQNRMHRAYAYLFGPQENPGEVIRPDNINQGVLAGNCELLAAVQSLASTPQGAESIEKMFSVNTDGSINVFFPDGVHQKTVYANLLDGGGSNKTGHWLPVLESAVESCLEDRDDRDETKGIKFKDVATLLTGTLDNTELIKEHSLADVDQLLSRFFQNSDGRTIIANTLSRHPDLPDEKPTLALEHADPPVTIERSHAFAVLGYENGRVILSNPWGHNKGYPDTHEHVNSTFSVSLQDFANSYQEICFSGPRIDLPKSGF